MCIYLFPPYSYSHTLFIPSLEAEKMSQVAQIEYDRLIMQKEKQKQMSQLESEANLAKIKSQADAEFYLANKQTESNRVRMSECERERVSE